jgi:hypothetical protein
MRPVSDRFLNVLRGSHKAIFRARVCETFQDGTDPTGTEIPILSGDVQFASAAEIRSTLALTTEYTWPRRATDLLAPYHNEIYVERGVSFGNGQREWVGLGYFRINQVSQDEVPGGPIEIAAADRMSGIIDARFLTPRQFPSTWTRQQLVHTLITEVYPDATIEWDDAGAANSNLNRNIVTEKDRAAILRDLVTSVGKIGYFDHRGIFVIKTPPSLTGPESWTIDAGRTGVLVEMQRAITREGIYNVVVASGEATDTTPPVTSIVADVDPNSPTRYGGPFGPVPRFYTSPFITTRDQARDAAAGLLRTSLGLPYSVDLTTIANPALEPDDVIAVRYPKSAQLVQSLRTEKHIIDSISIPLDPETAVSIQTRKQYGETLGDITDGQ